jgi:proline-specific peptidase
VVPAGGRRPGHPAAGPARRPGAGHDYLETLEGLADERPVIFYDQLGCGRSDKPDDPSRWHIARFVREVDLVRQALGLDRIHLLGQSWGGWLSVEYMLGQPAGIEGLVLASTSASIPAVRGRVRTAQERAAAGRPRDVAEYEAAQDYRNPAYEKAAEEFYKRHLCRLWPWPDPYLRTVQNLTDNQVYETMNGPNEFMVIGNLRTWDRIDRLGEIRARTLITVGKYDELSPTCAETLRQGIADPRGAVRAQLAHGAPRGDGRLPGDGQGRSWQRRDASGRGEPAGRDLLTPFCRAIAARDTAAALRPGDAVSWPTRGSTTAISGWRRFDHYVYGGDTALHVAAASHAVRVVRALIGRPGRNVAAQHPARRRTAALRRSTDNPGRPAGTPRPKPRR